METMKTMATKKGYTYLPLVAKLITGVEWFIMFTIFARTLGSIDLKIKAVILCFTTILQFAIQFLSCFSPEKKDVIRGCDVFYLERIAILMLAYSFLPNKIEYIYIASEYVTKSVWARFAKVMFTFCEEEERRDDEQVPWIITALGTSEVAKTRLFWLDRFAMLLLLFDNNYWALPIFLFTCYAYLHIHSHFSTLPDGVELFILERFGMLLLIFDLMPVRFQIPSFNRRSALRLFLWLNNIRLLKIIMSIVQDCLFAELKEVKSNEEARPQSYDEIRQNEQDLACASRDNQLNEKSFQMIDNDELKSNPHCVNDDELELESIPRLVCDDEWESIPKLMFVDHIDLAGISENEKDDELEFESIPRLVCDDEWESIPKLVFVNHIDLAGISENEKDDELELESITEIGNDDELELESIPEIGNDDELELESIPESMNDDDVELKSIPEFVNDVEVELKKDTECLNDEVIMFEIKIDETSSEESWENVIGANPDQVNHEEKTTDLNSEESWENIEEKNEGKSAEELLEINKKLVDDNSFFLDKLETALDIIRGLEEAKNKLEEEKKTLEATLCQKDVDIETECILDFLEDQCQELREEADTLSKEKHILSLRLNVARESLECYMRREKWTDLQALSIEHHKLSEEKEDLSVKLDAAYDSLECYKRVEKDYEEERSELMKEKDFLMTKLETLNKDKNKLSDENKELSRKLEAAYESVECYKQMEKDYLEERDTLMQENAENYEIAYLEDEAEAEAECYNQCLQRCLQLSAQLAGNATIARILREHDNDLAAKLATATALADDYGAYLREYVSGSSSSPAAFHNGSFDQD